MRRLCALLVLALACLPLSMFSSEGRMEEGMPAEYGFDAGGDSFRVILSPRRMAVLSAQIVSKVSFIAKEMGQPFEVGELLVQLEDTLFLAEEEKAEAFLEQASVHLNAREELFKDNVASMVELNDARSAAAAAKAEVVMARQNVSHCNIEAPYTGHVVRVLVHEHELVQIGQPLVEIVDDEVLLAKLLLPSAYFNSIHLGQPLSVHIQEVDTDVPAVISHIGSVIDPASSMIQVFARIDNKEGKLRAGMVGTVASIERAE